MKSFAPSSSYCHIAVRYFGPFPALCFSSFSRIALFFCFTEISSAANFFIGEYMGKSSTVQL